MVFQQHVMWIRQPAKRTFTLVNHVQSARTVRPTSPTQKSRSDAATGGNRSAMTMRVVPEAVEPRARAQVYSQHDLDWHRGDKTRGGNSR